LFSFCFFFLPLGHVHVVTSPRSAVSDHGIVVIAFWAALRPLAFFSILISMDSFLAGAVGWWQVGASLAFRRIAVADAIGSAVLLIAGY
jgi:hypothetical protein